MHLRVGGFLIVLSIAVGALVLSGTRVDTAAPKFYDDDPIAREPETRDASGVQPWDIPLAFDLALNLFARPGDRSDIRAQNVNTIDEVPDSSWFTNRILARAVSIDEAVRGPQHDRRSGAGQMDGDRGQDGRRRPRFHHSRSRRRSLVRQLRRRRAYATPPPARSRWRRASSGRWATTRSRTYLTTLATRKPRARRERAGDAALRATAADACQRSRGCVRRAPIARQTAGIASLPAAPCPASRSADSAITAPGRTIRTMSCRTSIAASCAR